jgi:hypothetical protein
MTVPWIKYQFTVPFTVLSRVTILPTHKIWRILYLRCNIINRGPYRNVKIKSHQNLQFLQVMFTVNTARWYCCLHKFSLVNCTQYLTPAAYQRHTLVFVRNPIELKLIWIKKLVCKSMTSIKIYSAKFMQITYDCAMFNYHILTS